MNIAQYYPLINIIIYIILKSFIIVFVYQLQRKLFSPIACYKIIIYGLLFLICFINIPIKNICIFILLLFNISIIESLLVIHLSSLPAMLINLVCNHSYQFNDYKIALFIGIIGVTLICLHEKVNFHI